MVAIRRCISGEEISIKDLITRIMNEEFHEDKDAYPTQDIEDIEQSYGGIGEAFFVAVDDEQIVGTVGIKKEDDRVALLRRLFVAPSHRNRKIGKKLIDRAIQFCTEVGYEEIVFKTTSRMSKAVEVCKKQGFIPRAKLALGPIELLKFSLPLRSEVKVTKDKS